MAHYLDQVSLLGSAHTPPGVSHGIREARDGIARCKAALRGWGVTVDDHPDDENSPPQPAPTGAAEVERALRAALPAESQAQAPGMARMISALSAGDLSAEALRERLTADPSFAQVLRSLVGQKVSLGQSAVSFGVGAQVGDVTIRDVVGRDIITINVYHGAPAVGLAAPSPPTTGEASRPLRVFLCHSSADKATVRRLSQMLTEGGAAPWLDEEQLIPGQDWKRAIPSAVESSDVVLVCLSRAAVSREGYLRDEIAFALTVAERRPEGEIFLIPLLLEPCEVPARLARWHWGSLSEPQGVGRLLRALRARAAELGAVVPTVSADAWLVSPPDVAPPLAPLTPADIERLWRQALSAALRRQWAQAEPLLAAIAVADPGYRDVQNRLAEARRQLGIQALYADLRAMRDADDWRAVLGGLADLESRQPGTPDTEGLRVWAEARQRREERYDAALAAADGGDWAAAVVALDALLAEAPGDADAAELLGHARAEREAQREARRNAPERQPLYSLLESTRSLIITREHEEALCRLESVGLGNDHDPELRCEVALRAAGLAELTTVPFHFRVRAAQLAGQLGDPRTPISHKDWRRELKWRAYFAQPSEWTNYPPPYFCSVPVGTYRIGGWQEGEPEAKIALPPFWIARLPLTVAQYAAFLADARGKDNTPYHWGTAPWDGLNQPVIGITWGMATAYCAWLSAQMADDLPPGYALRLPTEAEWEASAAYDAQGSRRDYPWGNDAPTPERAIYDASRLKNPAPVGCCPAGAAACGAMDMAGNVWEVTTSYYKGYPKQSEQAKKDFTGDYVPWRGGSWYSSSSNVRCGARIWDDLGLDFYHYGFRVVLAPQLGE